MKWENKEVKVINMAENKSYTVMRTALNENDPAQGKMFTVCENIECFFCI